MNNRFRLTRPLVPEAINWRLTATIHVVPLPRIAPCLPATLTRSLLRPPRMQIDTPVETILLKRPTSRPEMLLIRRRATNLKLM